MAQCDKACLVQQHFEMGDADTYVLKCQSSTSLGHRVNISAVTNPLNLFSYNSGKANSECWCYLGFPEQDKGKYRTK